MGKHYKDPKLKIFSLSSNRPLAEKIAEAVGLELGKISISRFSDGEVKVNVEESIRGAHVYIVQSTSDPVNDNLMELLIMIDALRRASAKTINVVMPYYGYARQERKAQSREPITAKLVANMITIAGADRILTLDLHAPQIQGFFDSPVDHLIGVPLLADYFLEKGLFGEDVVVVSPDHGGVVRARKLADFLKSPIAIIDKRRPRPNVSEVMNIIGDVAGKKCIIIDDMIDTAGTICHAAAALKEKGANHVSVMATHPVFSGSAYENLNKEDIDKIIVTNTLTVKPELTKVDFIDVSEILAENIYQIFSHK